MKLDIYKNIHRKRYSLYFTMYGFLIDWSANFIYYFRIKPNYKWYVNIGISLNDFIGAGFKFEKYGIYLHIFMFSFLFQIGKEVKERE